MLLIVLPQDTEIPAVPVKMGFNGSGNPELRGAVNSLVFFCSHLVLECRNAEKAVPYF